MKNMILIFLIGFTILGCKKDKVPIPIETAYYQSKGNLLILRIDDNFECIYEFNLASTVLNNDSLPLYYESFSDGMNNYSYLKFGPNLDTLIQNSSNNYTFYTNQIDKNELQNLGSSIPFDSIKFQAIGTQNNFTYSKIWSKISKLDIVKTYRNSNPTSKIGINSIIINEYDEQFGLSIPNEKYLIYLVK
jgi:hypothetical protein